MNIDPAAVKLARVELDRLRKKHKKHIDWHTAVAAYRAGAGPTPDVRKLPSKTHKHRMYAAADRVHRLLELAGERPHTLDEIAWLITRAGTALDPPLCPYNEAHGPLARRPSASMSAEQAWCGDWYDCQDVSCGTSTVYPTTELRRQLAEQAAAGRS